MRSIGDDIADFLTIFIIVIVIVIIIGAAVMVIDHICGYYLPDETMTVTVTHLDIDNGYYKVSVEGENISRVLTIESSLYARLAIGDTIKILQTGYHSPIRGDQYYYEIME